MAGAAKNHPEHAQRRGARVVPQQRRQTLGPVPDDEELVRVDECHPLVLVPVLLHDGRRLSEQATPT